MNYAAGWGTLEGLLIGIAIDCEYATKPIDGKELAAKLRAAIEQAKKRGEKYDEEHRNNGSM